MKRAPLVWLYFPFLGGNRRTWFESRAALCYLFPSQPWVLKLKPLEFFLVTPIHLKLYRLHECGHQSVLPVAGRLVHAVDDEPRRVYGSLPLQLGALAARDM